MEIKNTYSYWSENIVEECRMVLNAVDEDVDEEYIQLVLSSRQLFFIGVGRVLLSLKSIAKRYNHLGISCSIVGDVTEPAITMQDLLIVGSGSGNTLIPVAISKKAKQIGAKVVQIGCNPDGDVGKIADLFVRLPAQSKKTLPEEIKSIQPMTSLFEQSLLLFGDITAAMIIERKNIDIQTLWKFHANLE